MTIEEITSEFLKGLNTEFRILFARAYDGENAWTVGVTLKTIRKNSYNNTTIEEYKSTHRVDDMSLLKIIRTYLEDTFYTTNKNNLKCIRVDHSLIDELLRLNFKMIEDTDMYIDFILELEDGNTLELFKTIQEVLTLKPQGKVKKFRDLYE